MAPSIGIPELVILGLLVWLGIYLYGRWKKRSPKSPQMTHDEPRATPKDTVSPPLAPATPVVHAAPPKPTAYVFLSYASSDRDAAQNLAMALARHGWKVWWDRSILPGKTFDQEIEAALDGAGCVIVLWSRHSVQSEWVKTEAAEGARRQVLIPALLEDVTIPLEFRRIQGAHLGGWTPSSTKHDGFDSLVRAVAERIGPSSLSATVGS